MEFVDNLDSRKHIVFFYENLDYGLMVQLRFIKNGLLKGEHCIYATHEDTKAIENQMAYGGINVEDFKRKNLLHVYQIPNAMDDPEGALKGAEKITKMMLADSKPPLRIISVFIPEVNTVEEMMAGVDIERNRHASFGDLQCSWLCPYYLENIQADIREEFMGRILRNHHVVIYVNKRGIGTADDIP
jgi:hypothetical protein